jgi:molybdopterin-guanine dinucleotide biosynthesis protein A
MTAAPARWLPVAAAVIAGGAATRLGGVAKSALLVGGRSIAARQLEPLRATFARVVVIANVPGPWAELGIEVWPDLAQGAGPLAGVHAALVATAAHAGVVCVAGDMPFVAAPLLRLLRDRDPDADAVVPRRRGAHGGNSEGAAPFPEPLLARYGRGCLPVVEAQLAAGQRAVHDALARLAVTWLDEAELRAVEPSLRSFTNVNTPEDLARAERDALADVSPEGA